MSELYTVGIFRPSSRLIDGLRCLMLMALSTLRFILKSSDVKLLVFCGSMRQSLNRDEVLEIQPVYNSLLVSRDHAKSRD